MTKSEKLVIEKAIGKVNEHVCLLSGALGEAALRSNDVGPQSLGPSALVSSNARIGGLMVLAGQLSSALVQMKEALAEVPMTADRYKPDHPDKMEN